MKRFSFLFGSVTALASAAIASAIDYGAGVARFGIETVWPSHYFAHDVTALRRRSTETIMEARSDLHHPANQHWFRAVMHTLHLAFGASQSGRGQLAMSC